LIFPLKLAKLGITGNKAELSVEVVNLKVDPDDMEGLLTHLGVYPSYHMSKKNWISFVLDDSLSDDALWELVARSRQLA
ncbi:MmcQ/YjbR family DNA-binding protein, partial [Streptococcus pyogenes]